MAPCRHLSVRYGWRRAPSTAAPRDDKPRLCSRAIRSRWARLSRDRASRPRGYGLHPRAAKSWIRGIRSCLRPRPMPRCPSAGARARCRHRARPVLYAFSGLLYPSRQCFAREMSLCPRVRPCSSRCLVWDGSGLLEPSLLVGSQDSEPAFDCLVTGGLLFYRCQWRPAASR